MKIINLPKISDPRGNLTFLQFPDQIPFAIKRVFWSYDVPGGEIRGGHAYKTQNEFIVALSGSFDVVVTDSYGKSQILSLNRSYKGILIPALNWRHLENFSTNALALHISSTIYNENDYIRDFKEYSRIAK
jgi:dTDP-4-dehydrorhamnose 3,5-epimerase-like enzyme